MFSGTEQKCNDFINEQGDALLYKVVPIIHKQPRKLKYNALRMSDKKYADDYGAKMKRYREWEESEK